MIRLEHNGVCKVVSLFSGAGGLDLGFKMAGHDIIWANDMYADAVETYKKNIGDHIICEDISRIKAEDISGLRYNYWRISMSGFFGSKY